MIMIYIYRYKHKTPAQKNRNNNEQQIDAIDTHILSYLDNDFIFNILGKSELSFFIVFDK